MHISYTQSCYSLAQLLGTYDTYTLYTQYLLYGPVTELISYQYHIDITATAQLMGSNHTNSIYMEFLHPGLLAHHAYARYTQ